MLKEGNVSKDVAADIAKSQISTEDLGFSSQISSFHYQLKAENDQANELALEDLLPSVSEFLNVTYNKE